MRVSTAQTIRAVLLAMATVATRAGLRSSKDVSHLLARSGWDRVCRTSDVIPTTSNDRRYWSPILVIRPSFSLPPLDLFAGVKPSQAANSRPLRNWCPSPMLATMTSREASAPEVAPQSSSSSRRRRRRRLWHQLRFRRHPLLSRIRVRQRLRQYYRH